MSSKPYSSRFEITSPCTEDWDAMVGNDQIRFCKHCQRSVHDFSQMTSKMIRRLIAQSNGRICVRYSDVTPRPAPVLYKIGRRTSKIAASAFSAAIGLSGAMAANAGPKQHSNFYSNAVTTRDLKETALNGGTGSLRGVIFDPNGAAIPGATVTLINLETKQIVSASANGEGEYTFNNLAVGIYSMKVEASGFAATEVTSITLRENDANRIDQTLGIATINETVEVLSGPSVVMGGAMISVPGEPLVKAATEDNLDAVKEELIKTDANVRDKATEWTALECAVRNGNREMVQVLLWAKADVNARDSHGQTVLMTVNDNVTTDLVWDLLNAGAKVNARDEDGDTPLYEISGINNTEVLKTLLDVGAKVNAVNKEGQSALMRAASEGLVNNIRLLIQAGADINQRDKEGKTALTYAREGEHRAAIRLLVSMGAIEFERNENEK